VLINNYVERRRIFRCHDSPQKKSGVTQKLNLAHSRSSTLSKGIPLSRKGRHVHASRVSHLDRNRRLPPVGPAVGLRHVHQELGAVHHVAPVHRGEVHEAPVLGEGAPLLAPEHCAVNYMVALVRPVHARRPHGIVAGEALRPVHVDVGLPCRSLGFVFLDRCVVLADARHVVIGEHVVDAVVLEGFVERAPAREVAHAFEDSLPGAKVKGSDWRPAVLVVDEDAAPDEGGEDDDHDMADERRNSDLRVLPADRLSGI